MLKPPTKLQIHVFNSETLPDSPFQTLFLTISLNHMCMMQYNAVYSLLHIALCIHGKDIKHATTHDSDLQWHPNSGCFFWLESQSTPQELVNT